jgi:DNA modification methylase
MNSSSSTIEITERSVNDLRPPERSVRTHNRAQERKLTRIIRKHGIVAPIIVDPNGNIINGELVWKCSKKLGFDSVPTVVVRTNDPAAVKALRLALNRVAEDAGWDKENLREELKYLLEVDYELDLTGFDAPEIDAILEIETPTIGVVDLDEEELPTGPAVADTGDIIACGRHRIACGDARDPALLARLRGKNAVRMVMTDPPFNIPIDGFVGGKGGVRHREFAHASGEMSDAEFLAFLAGFFTTAMTTLIPGALVYTWMDWRHIDTLIAAGKQSGLALLNICVWAKTTAGMGSLYRSQHELCSIFKFGSEPHVNNVELGKHGRSRSNLWTARGMASFGRERNELSLHPTIKPVRLLADAILDASKRGDTVLDSFLGSGSTLLACDEIGRRCFGVEIDPLYVDVAVRRWQRATRRDAIFEDTGETFDERAVRRAAEAADLETSGSSADTKASSVGITTNNIVGSAAHD